MELIAVHNRDLHGSMRVPLNWQVCEDYLWYDTSWLPASMSVQACPVLLFCTQTRVTK